VRSADSAGNLPDLRADSSGLNQVWPADFKGQFKTGDGQYCYPLTVTDHFSRALLVCRGLASVKTALTQPVFRALFREVGLPEAIRTDNGAPFASTGIHGLSPLNVWWMQLGIVYQRITPADARSSEVSIRCCTPLHTYRASELVAHLSPRKLEIAHALARTLAGLPEMIVNRQ
jgi:hypothetical protein